MKKDCLSDHTKCSPSPGSLAPDKNHCPTDQSQTIANAIPMIPMPKVMPRKYDCRSLTTTVQITETYIVNLTSPAARIRCSVRLKTDKQADYGNIRKRYDFT